MPSVGALAPRGLRPRPVARQLSAVQQLYRLSMPSGRRKNDPTAILEGRGTVRALPKPTHQRSRSPPDNNKTLRPRSAPTAVRLRVSAAGMSSRRTPCLCDRDFCAYSETSWRLPATADRGGARVRRRAPQRRTRAARPAPDEAAKQDNPQLCRACWRRAPPRARAQRAPESEISSFPSFDDGTIFAADAFRPQLAALRPPPPDSVRAGSSPRMLAMPSQSSPPRDGRSPDGPNAPRSHNIGKSTDFCPGILRAP